MIGLLRFLDTAANGNGLSLKTTQKQRICVHMFMWAFVLVLVSGTRLEISKCIFDTPCTCVYTGMYTCVYKYMYT